MAQILRERQRPGNDAQEEEKATKQEEETNAQIVQSRIEELKDL